MSILKPDINAGMRLFAETAGAVLLDVRTREEYADGHIYGSVNIPIGTITDFPRRYADRSTPRLHILQKRRKERQSRFVSEIARIQKRRRHRRYRRLRRRDIPLTAVYENKKYPFVRAGTKGYFLSGVSRRSPSFCRVSRKAAFSSLLSYPSGRRTP